MHISNIIPTHNRCEALLCHLLAIPRQSIPAKDYEVIVVCDNCEDGTEEMLANTSDWDLPYSLQVIYTDDHGVAQARNLGVQSSSGEVIIFHDDDVLPHRKCFENLYAKTSSGSASIGYLSPSHEARCYGEEPLWRQFVTGNVALWRNDFLAVGGFDENLQGWGGEDHLLGYQLNRSGVVLQYVPEAEIIHLWPFPYNVSPKSSDQKWDEARRNHQLISDKYGIKVFS